MLSRGTVSELHALGTQCLSTHSQSSVTCFSCAGSLLRYAGFALVAANGSLLLLVGFLTAATFSAEHGLQGTRAQ